MPHKQNNTTLEVCLTATLAKETIQTSLEPTQLMQTSSPHSMGDHSVSQGPRKLYNVNPNTLQIQPMYIYQVDTHNASPRLIQHKNTKP